MSREVIYEKEGHTRFNWNENYNNSKDVIYETLNEKELWAKCYQYIMLSLIDRDINENDKIFVKYFGENIELAKKMLAQIRELPDEERF